MSTQIDKHTAAKRTMNFYHAAYFATALASVDARWGRVRASVQASLGPHASSRYAAMQEAVMESLQGQETHMHEHE